MSKTNLILVTFLVLTLAAISPAGARVNIGVNIGLPPLVFSSPPVMAVSPGTYVYCVPDVGTDIFFYEGYWYRPYDGAWYYSESYNGPWVYIEAGRVPAAILALPLDIYLSIGPGWPRVPYVELRTHWRRWQAERYWRNHEAWRRGFRRHEEFGQHRFGEHRGFEGPMSFERGPRPHEGFVGEPRFGESRGFAGHGGFEGGAGRRG
jgi:hypothetical protein